MKLKGNDTGLQLDEDTTLGEKSIATEEYVNTKVGGYLPLSGGTMTTTNPISRDTDNSYIHLCGGKDEKDGAFLSLTGINYGGYDDNSGFALALPKKDGSMLTLLGNSNGSLTWNGKNVTLQGDCLPLSGGTMSGGIKFPVSVNGWTISGVETNCSVAFKSTENYNDGACLILRGKDATSGNGLFDLRAQDGTITKQLVGKPDGTLTWAGNEVERVVAQGDGYIRYVSGLQMCWGSGNNISNISTGKNRFTYPAAFISDPSVSIFSIFSSADVFFYKTSLAFVGTSNFMFYAFGYDDNLTGDMFAVSWIAIGRWK